MRRPKVRFGGIEALPDAPFLHAVRRASFLPAIVDLNHIDTQTCAGQDLVGQKLGGDTPVLPPVAPGVGNQQTVAPRLVGAKLVLKVVQRRDTSGGAVAVRQGRPGVALAALGPDTVPQQRERFRPGQRDKIRRIGTIGLRVRQRCHFNKHEARSGQNILGEEQVPCQRQLSFGGVQKPFLLKRQLIVIVGAVPKRYLRQAQVEGREFQRLQDVSPRRGGSRGGTVCGLDSRWDGCVFRLCLCRGSFCGRRRGHLHHDAC